LRLANYSLRRRLLVSATILLLVFLGVLGVGLNNAFKQSVLSNAEDALKNQVLLLMANIDVDAGQIIVPPVLS
jgi:two-component system sensor histidine kinase PhoQ